MVLEELSHSQLIVECHSADEYAQIDMLLKEFGGVDCDHVGSVSEDGARARPYYYVDRDRRPSFSATLADAFCVIGDVPWLFFTEFMSALLIEENEQEPDLEPVSLEGVL